MMQCVNGNLWFNSGVYFVVEVEKGDRGVLLG